MGIFYFSHHLRTLLKLGMELENMLLFKMTTDKRRPGFYSSHCTPLIHVRTRSVSVIILLMCYFCSVSLCNMHTIKCLRIFLFCHLLSPPPSPLHPTSSDRSGHWATPSHLIEPGIHSSQSAHLNSLPTEKGGVKGGLGGCTTVEDNTDSK